MKKKLIILYPYKFSNFEYFKFEINYFKRLGYRVCIVDLSNILSTKKFNNVWKSKKYKYAILPNSIIDVFNLLKKNRKSIIINFNYSLYNIFNCIILFFIKILKIKQIFIEDKAVLKKLKIHKNINWLFSKIKYYKFNFTVYKFYLNNYFSYFLIKLFKLNNFALFTNLKLNDQNAEMINSYDYSNNLVYSKKKNKLKNYCLYIDNGAPYFNGDGPLKGMTPKDDIKQTYLEMISFFKKVQEDFNCEIIIIPHPKYKSPKKNHSFNPYYKGFKIENRESALPLLSKYCKFILSRGSSANAYGVIHNKPIVNFYSSNSEPEFGNSIGFIDAGLSLNNPIYDICYYSKQNFKKKLKVDKREYKSILFSCLTKKKICLSPNFKIISNYIKRML